MQQHLYVLGGTYFRENDTNYQTGRFEAFNLETGAWTEVTYFYKLYNEERRSRII